MPDEAGTAPALQLAAKSLHESVQNHKLLERHHRRQARQKRRQLEELQARCAEAGVPLFIYLTDIAEEAQS